MTYNDGTGPQYDRPRRHGLRLDAANVEHEDGSPVEVGADGYPLLTGGEPPAETPQGDPQASAGAPETPTEPQTPTEPASGAQEGEQPGGEAQPMEVVQAEVTEATEQPEPEEEAEPDEGFDPSGVNVATVIAYLDANPNQTEYVLNRERAGKARTTILNREEN